jgi:peroxiredoxin family protein
MNIDNISEGLIVKNYKVMCELLEQPTKTGKAKQLQISDWERYFVYSKSGYSFIINKILETPTDKTDLRVNGNNKAKYIDKIEFLILDLLAQNGNDGQVFLSRNKLLYSLQMVNQNYSYGKIKPMKLSKIVDVTKEEINDFYQTSDRMLKRNLETALDGLRSQALITWKNSLTICLVESKAEINEFNSVKAIKLETIDEDGDMEVEFSLRQSDKGLIHRKATIEEEQLIIHTEREVLKAFGCKTISDVFKINKAEIFYKHVKEILFEQANIYLYYHSYEIISNKDHILEELNTYEKRKIQEEINNDIVEKLKLNTANRYNRAFDKYDETSKDKYVIRMDEMYCENNFKLTDTLVKLGVSSIKMLSL